MGDAKPSDRDTEKNAPGNEYHAGGAVLFMDDEHNVRKISKQMLECLGYQATVCSNGEEAVRLYKIATESGTPFMAVIMDLDIPGGMGGKEAAGLILAIDPDARLVVSSGNHHDPGMTDFDSYGFCSAMPKPYRISHMSSILENLPEPGKTAKSGKKPPACKNQG